MFFQYYFQTRVDDGKWHRIKILRKRRIGVLQVDKTKPSRGKSEPGASILNTDGKIWIGKKNKILYFDVISNRNGPTQNAFSQTGPL